MLLYCKYPNYTVNFQSPKYAPGPQGLAIQVKPRIKFAFVPLLPPRRIRAIPAKHSEEGALMRGWLDTKIVAKRVHVSEEKIVKHLMGLPAWGIDFVGVGSDGFPIKAPADYIIPLGENGPYYSELTGKTIPNAQGLGSHLISKEYLAVVEARRKELYGEVFEEMPPVSPDRPAVSLGTA